jgi:hypothetical protein
MFDIYSSDWPEIERALVAFSKEEYFAPVIIWHTTGGFIEQDMTDGCGDPAALSSDDAPPLHGLWVWEGTFQPLDDIYDNSEGVGAWRQPTDDEWICIIEQRNPWSVNE